MRLPQHQNPQNAYHKMQLDFLNERKYVSRNINQYFESHFVTSYFNTTTTLKTGLLFFIDTTRNENYRQYINDNFDLIDQLIDSKNRNFIYNKDLKIDNTHIWFANYYYPFLREKLNPNHYLKINSLQLLEFTGILNDSSENTLKKKDITTGFLSIHSKGVSYIGKNDNETIEAFIKTYIKTLVVDTGASEPNLFYSIKDEDSDEPFIEIDADAQKIIDWIDLKLEELKETGKLFAVAPKIQELLKIHFNSVTTEDKQISTLIVTEDYKIYLPEYNNMEVELNHLTKAIYILFLKHSKIHLKDFKQYKDELLAIYKNISYKNDYDQIKKSIDHLITDKNAIFVHLSRIKSRFTLLFSDYYADNYYIQGDRGKEKYIKLNKAKIKIEAKV